MESDVNVVVLRYAGTDFRSSTGQHKNELVILFKIYNYLNLDKVIMPLCRDKGCWAIFAGPVTTRDDSYVSRYKVKMRLMYMFKL